MWRKLNMLIFKPLAPCAEHTPGADFNPTRQTLLGKYLQPRPRQPAKATPFAGGNEAAGLKKAPRRLFSNQKESVSPVWKLVILPL
jgi:hypothetical protein